MAMPDRITAAEAAGILGCPEDELEVWRRTVLPGGPRKSLNQTDDQFRPDEVVAVAVGRWLRSTKSSVAENFAARLALSIPEGEDWGVLSRNSKKVEIINLADPRQVRVRARAYDPSPIFEAIRSLSI